MGQQQSKLTLDQVSHLQQTTHFDSSEIKQWHKSFMEDFPSGVISREDFYRGYRDMFPFGNASTYADLVFTVLDRDRSGTVDFSEFLTALSKTTRGTLAEKLDWTFRLYDVNRDGFVSRAEMLRIVDAMYQMMGDSVPLKEDEATPEKRVDKLFAAMDTDHDGRLSKQEFIDGSQKDPLICQALQMYDRLV
jgi:Ca2+-binding EF-hand superfamily protein